MQRFLHKIASLAHHTPVVACSSERSPNPTITDSRFGISISKTIRLPSDELELMGIARRCMHDLCWFSPARAYVLGIYMNPAVVNRVSVSSDMMANRMAASEVPKTFVLFFASNKDSRHIKNGFERSYSKFVEECSPKGRSINSLLSVFSGKESVKQSDTLTITCNPGKSSVRVSMSDQPEIEISNADDLIEWLHWLYLGTEARPQARYPSIQKELFSDFANSTRYREIIDA